jgi:hypothetical protein
MTDRQPAFIFDREMAASYDKGNAVFALLRDALNFLMRTILSELPSDAQILCVGVGTGSEVIVGEASPSGESCPSLSPMAVHIGRASSTDAGYLATDNGICWDAS